MGSVQIFVVNNPAGSITQEDILNSGSYSRFGRRVFSDIILSAGDYKITFIHTLISVDPINTIVSTPLQGKRGTAKEYIQAQDYEVQITGTLSTDQPDMFPRNEVKDLIRILKKAQSLDVVSEYLALFDISKLVFTRGTFRQLEGTQNVQPFELSFLSDEDIQLTITEEKQ
jgi:hypothetical protein